METESEAGMIQREQNLSYKRGAVSVDQTQNQKQYVSLLRGEILQELERLRNMANHKQHLEEIKQLDRREIIKASVQKYETHVVHQIRQQRADFDHQRKIEMLTKENAKILQKIVEARQINVKARSQFVSSIKKEEDRSRSVRDAI